MRALQDTLVAVNVEALEPFRGEASRQRLVGRGETFGGWDFSLGRLCSPLHQSRQRQAFWMLVRPQGSTAIPVRSTVDAGSTPLASLIRRCPDEQPEPVAMFNEGQKLVLPSALTCETTSRDARLASGWSCKTLGQDG